MEKQKSFQQTFLSGGGDVGGGDGREEGGGEEGGTGGGGRGSDGGAGGGFCSGEAVGAGQAAINVSLLHLGPAPSCKTFLFTCTK